MKMDIDLMKKIKEEANKVIKNINKDGFEDSQEWGNVRCIDVEYIYSLDMSTRYEAIVEGAPFHAIDLRDYIEDKLRAKFNVPIFVELEW